MIREVRGSGGQEGTRVEVKATMTLGCDYRIFNEVIEEWPPMGSVSNFKIKMAILDPPGLLSSVFKALTPPHDNVIDNFEKSVKNSEKKYLFLTLKSTDL